jgi:acetyl esterase/lipase
MAALCELLKRRGMVAVTIDYRLAPKYKWPAQLDDSQAAVRYLRGHAKELGIDKDRIGAAGASAGAHLALLLGFRNTRDTASSIFPTESSKVKVVFDLFGPSDFSRDFSPSIDPVVFMLTGKKRADASDIMKEASPATYVDKNSAPVYILHGKADTLVPIAQSEWLESLLKEVKVEVKSSFVEGMNHGIDKNTPGVTEGVLAGVEFLEKHLAK